MNAGRAIRFPLRTRTFHGTSARHRQRQEHDQEVDAGFPSRQTRSACAEIMREKYSARWRFDQSQLVLAATPIAVHARHDHRAARPEFLYVGCRAIPHRIAARKIVRIDVIRFRLAARIDRHASRRPSNPDLAIGLRGGGWRRLRRPYPGWRGLRFRSGCGQQKCPDKGQPNCRRLDPHHRAHPNPLSTLRSPIAAPTSTGPEAQNRYLVSAAGQAFSPKCYKRTPCGLQPKRHR
jgi:hypothetical protein